MFEGSSSGSNPSIEPPDSCTRNSFSIDSKNVVQRGIVCNHGNRDVLSGRERCVAKNLVAERNRRNRIKEGLLALRALVPKISKMDKASILGDAIDYILELKSEIQSLEDTLNEINECKENITKIQSSKPQICHENQRILYDVMGFQGLTQGTKNEMQLDVSVIDNKGFLIKALYRWRQGGFRRLMENISSLGLQVVDANVTTHNGMVMNILFVEAHSRDMDTSAIKESLWHNLVEAKIKKT